MELSIAAGRIAKIKTRKEGDWCACTLRVEQGPSPYQGRDLSVSGVFPDVAEGRFYACELTFAPHRLFGDQWKATQAVPTTPTTVAGLVAYLSDSFPGIGPKRAAALVQQFGPGITQVLDSADAVSALCSVAKMTPTAADEVIAVWHKRRMEARSTVILYEAGWTASQVARAHERFALALETILAENPYRLTELKGIGFGRVDAVAMKMGISPRHGARLIAACKHVLGQERSKGHCWMPWGEMIAACAAILMRPVDELMTDLRGELASGASSGKPSLIIDERERCWLPGLWMAHQTVCQEACVRIRVQRALGSLHQKVTNAHATTLSEEQRAAVDYVLDHTLVVLTGGPGTGKTTVVKAIIDACVERLQSPCIRLAAPTGKAANRLYESTAIKATTIHRLLDWKDDGPQRTSASPIDADLIVIDEASMIDLELAAALFSALPATCRLVLVGDVDQLPSVGPGQVLADLIAGGAPTAVLNTVFRQSGDSLILKAAHAVNRGQAPVFGDEKRHDLFLIPVPEEDRIGDEVVKLVTKNIPERRKIDVGEIRVLTAMNSGPGGVDTLNVRIRDVVNPPAPTKDEIRTGDDIFRVGDRLVWLSNSSDLDLFNGEELRLQRVERHEKDVFGILETDDRRLLRIHVSALDARLAYAFTIHKSQGSEYAAVVIVVHQGAYHMWERRLLYTAMTRAKQFCVLVGDQSIVGKAVQCVISSKRRSGLGEDLKALSSVD